jgi:hypothetical protein
MQQGKYKGVIACLPVVVVFETDLASVDFLHLLDHRNDTLGNDILVEVSAGSMAFYSEPTPATISEKSREAKPRPPL